MDALCLRPAVELAGLLRRREVGARELLEGHLARIARLDPGINAIVTLAGEQARAAADATDTHLARGEAARPLAGLPLAVKDIFPTAGVRTTYGSRLFHDHVPDRDALIVARAKRAGASLIGKTNTPEFAYGAQTVNPLFPVTRNPYDPARSVSGSSGGGAAALAAGMAALADGSDLGGSLRAPAAWCNVVGFRPSPGRIPFRPTAQPFDRLHVPGTMGRTVADVALFLSAVAGPDPSAPVSIDEDPAAFAAPLERDFRGARIAWSMTPDGATIDPRVAEVMAAARAVLEDLGCRVEDACPNLAGARAAQQVFRLMGAAAEFGEAADRQGDLLGQSVKALVAAARGLSADDILEAVATQGRIWHEIRGFMAHDRFLVWPVNMAPPYGAELAETEIAADWRAQEIAPVLGLPAISVPAGFTADGLPAGLQIIGAPGCDFEVLQLAHAFEQATGFWKHPPPAG